MKRLYSPWFDLAADTWRLGAEAQEVVGLRLAKLVMGDAAAAAEAHRMISEKVFAAAEVHAKTIGGVLAGQAHLAPGKAVALYRRKVRANRRRLRRRSS